MNLQPLSRPFISCLAILLLSTLAESAEAAEMDFSHWLEDGAGYEAAMKTHEADARPVVVYFRTDWCPYCRQFEDALLEVPEVIEEMKKMVLVRVNPENGDAEMQLAARYGVSGYPAMFVHSTKAKIAVPVDRTLVLRGRRVMKTPLEFISALRSASVFVPPAKGR